MWLEFGSESKNIRYETSGGILFSGLEVLKQTFMNVTFQKCTAMSHKLEARKHIYLRT